MANEKLSDDDQFDDSLLTPEERREVRGLLEERRRIRWLRKKILSIAMWAGAVAAAITMFSDSAKRGLKALLGL